MRLATSLVLVSLTACAIEEAGDVTYSEHEAHGIIGPVTIPPVQRTTKSIVDEMIGPLNYPGGRRRYVGVSVVVIRDGAKSQYHYGERVLGSGLSPNSNTLYPLASLNKTFTGTLLALANRRGIIDGFDDLLDQHTSYPLGGERALIELQDLALHHSGLPHDAPGDIDYTTGSYAGDFSAFMHSLDECSSGCAAPISRYGESSYSNYGYGVLGYVLAQKMGGTIHSIYRNNFFTPLGMTRTGYKWELLDNACVVGGASTCTFDDYGDCDYTSACNGTFSSNAVVTYNKDGANFVRSEHEGADATEWMPGGSIWSTPHDMLEWLALHTGSSTAAPTELKQIVGPTHHVRTLGGMSFFGVQKQTSSGRVFMRKGGWLPGQVSTFIGVLDDGQTGVVVMANDGSFDVTTAGTRILDRL